MPKAKRKMNDKVRTYISSSKISALMDELKSFQKYLPEEGELVEAWVIAEVAEYAVVALTEQLRGQHFGNQELNNNQNQLKRIESLEPENDAAETEDDETEEDETTNSTGWNADKLKKLDYQNFFKKS